MEVTVTSHRESCEVTLRVAAKAVEIESFIRAAGRRLSREHPVKGFRPGRAPVEVVERSVGTERLMHAALERALPRLVAAALQERTIEAIGRPAVSIEQATRRGGIAFRARVAVLPTVTLGKLSLLKEAERRPVTVSDDDVERELKQLAKMRSQYRVVPEINDAFARQLGDFKDVASLRYTLKSNLMQERERRETERCRAALVKQLAEHAEFSPLPAVLVDKEVEQRMAELQSVLELQQTTLTAYVAERGTTVAAVREEMRAAAVQAVKIGLALRQFAAEQQITVTAEELDKAGQEYRRRFASPVQAKRVEEPARLKERLADWLRNQKTLERLEQVALGKAG